MHRTNLLTDLQLQNIGSVHNEANSISPLYIYRSTLDLGLVCLLTYIADLEKYVFLVSLSYKIILCFICHCLTDNVQVSHITPLP